MSSTLKLGISILNGGNADVQQVGSVRPSVCPSPCPSVRPRPRLSAHVSACPSVRPSSPPEQKMLDYLKEKREVGFFQSVQALMQTCR